MDKETHIARIKDFDSQIKTLEKKKAEQIQMLKREHGFCEGDKVKIIRMNYNLEKGEDEKEEYYLFIRSVYFHPKLLDFQYTFSHITSGGKQSQGKCSIYHQPKTDKIERA